MYLRGKAEIRKDSVVLCMEVLLLMTENDGPKLFYVLHGFLAAACYLCIEL